MAKTYIDIVKYMVTANFEIKGMVEKPDIIGAVFGQTEGLLGTDLDLRELQKNGKIGRIEIESNATSGRTHGKLYLPSSLSRVETCILGAAIETVDRVGPFETSFKVLSIDDTRNEKRKNIVNRAKELLKTMSTTDTPGSKEITDLVESEFKSSVIGTYGPDALPAGPDIASNEEVIIVEGRADVINLLKCDIANAIAVGGAAGKIPKTILDLCAKKTVTLFVDGDRGGDMIIRNMISAAEIDFVAKAPDGKEVEELARKEIIKSLRNRMSMDQYMSINRISNPHNGRNHNGEHEGFRNHSMEREPERNERRYPPSEVRQPQEAKETRREPHSEVQEQRQAQHDEFLSPDEIGNRVRNVSKPSYPEERGERQREPRSQSRESSFDLGIKELDSRHESSGMPSIPDMGGSSAHSQAHGIDEKLASGFMNALDDLKNTLRGRLYDSNGGVIKEVPIREIIPTLQDANGTFAVVFDGIITQRLLDLAYKSGIKALYGIRSSQITRKYDSVLVYTAEHQ